MLPRNEVSILILLKTGNKENGMKVVRGQNISFAPDNINLSLSSFAGREQ